jgi:hypothetical protein
MSSTKASKDVEYFVKQVDDVHFEVAKFNFRVGSEPIAVYKVRYNPATGAGRCDCPAASYRGTGAEDKHVKMVKEWLEKSLQGS